MVTRDLEDRSNNSKPRHHVLSQVKSYCAPRLPTAKIAIDVIFDKHGHLTSLPIGYVWRKAQTHVSRYHGKH
jgi:hypothetical protein